MGGPGTVGRRLLSLGRGPQYRTLTLSYTLSFERDAARDDQMESWEDRPLSAGASPTPFYLDDDDEAPEGGLGGEQGLERRPSTLITPRGSQQSRAYGYITVRVRVRVRLGLGLGRWRQQREGERQSKG